MGYRSEVLLALKDEKVVELFMYFSDIAAINITEYVEIHKRNGWTLLSFEDVKWYDDYPEVKAINEFVDTLDEDEYEFHIMGEDNDDYTVRGEQGNSPFNIYISRELNFDP